MDMSCSSNKCLPTDGDEAYSAFSLLERAKAYIQQENLPEAVVFLKLARERLAPSQTQLASMLDAFIEEYSDYQRAQYLLQEASRHFAEADAELKRRTAHFAATLPVHMNKAYTETTSPDLVSEIPDQQPLQLPPRVSHVPPDLYITCFGRFEVRRSGKPIQLCSSRNGQCILRYLVARPERCATRDVLQSLFWPEAEAAVAQNKLHIAISALRRSLNQDNTTAPGGGCILCSNGVYSLNPTSAIHTDVDEFLHYYQEGRQRSEEQVTLYEKACQLYTGPFLTEDLYADWSFLQREQLSKYYLNMCQVLANHYLQNRHYENAMHWATAILLQNRCHEKAHQQLMQIYLALGQRCEASQQYQHCERALRQELGVSPLPETKALLETLHSNSSSP